VPDDDPLAEYEAEMSHVVDPSGFRPDTMAEHNGARIVELVSEATDLVVTDLVQAMNNDKPALCQYLLPNGLSIICFLVNPRSAHIVVQLPADEEPFVTLTPKDKA
jgi:hypothetical protein